jgi:hypothetical protein
MARLYTDPPPLGAIHLADDRLDRLDRLVPRGTRNEKCRSAERVFELGGVSMYA